LGVLTRYPSKGIFSMHRRDFSRQLAATSLVIGVPSLVQAQGAPREGTHYVRLGSPAPVAPAAGKAIDVVEFFWYGCPHCYAFEPLLETWAKRLPADVSFRQVPVGFMAPHQNHQRLFFALEEMGALPTLHRKVFNAMHQQGKRLANDADIAQFAKDNGADGDRLVQLMKGFSVSTKATRAKQLADAYKIDGVPALGIHGRFYTAASLAGSHERALSVTDFLIQQARQRG
jgi:protein dithiol oxidoreductase (disulfide-forming)